MPLITSTTQLNKWKFGMGPWSDTRGGGNSNQPYIVRGIPGVNPDDPNQTFEQVADGDLPLRSGPDFILRDGFLAPQAAARDVSRLAQMLVDVKSPNGPLFIAKQNLLSRTSVSTQASGGPGYGAGAVNQGIYTPLATLGQAGSGFSGNHLNLLGLDPTDPMANVGQGGGLFPGLGLQTYESSIKSYQNAANFTIDNNRLTALNDGVNNNTSTNNFGFVKGYNLLPNNVQGSPLLISYGGGPGSVLGIGKTSIRFADQRTGNQNKLASTDPTYFYTGSRPNSKTSSSIKNPTLGGASTTYENIIGETGSLGLDEYDSSGGYTTNPTFDYLTTDTTSSLTPRGDIGTYQTSRPNSRTSSSIKNPTLGGASATYENIVGETGSLGLDKYDSSGGYTTTPTFDYLTTDTTSSLTPRGDIGTYQTLRPNSKTSSSLINPIVDGLYSSSSLSTKYKEHGGVQLSESLEGRKVLDSTGGYTYGQNWDNSTTESGSLNASADLNLYQALRPNSKTSSSIINPIVDGFYSSSSLSTKYKEHGGVQLSESLDGRKVLDSSGGYTYDQNWYNSTTESGSLNPGAGLNLYQTTPLSVKTRDGQFEGGIRINYDNAISGSSNLYKTLTGTEFDNNYTDKYFFNVYDPNTTPGNTWPTNTPLIYANGAKTYSQTQLINKDNVIEGGASGLYPVDFRKEMYNVDGDDEETTQNSSVLSLSPNYRTKNKDVRLYMGQPGKSNNDNGTKNVWNYGVKATDLTALDKVTAAPMYSSGGPDTNQAINDLVKFRIAAINNDRTDGNAVYMHFRAFLDSFSDNYTATWSAVNYVGRGEALHNYGGFGRTISLSWTVAAQSKAELIPMYKKLNYLASTLAPDYSEQGYMRGNLVRLTVGGYLFEQPGFMTSLTYDISQDTSWEIAINAEGDSDSSVKELPHMIKVTANFTPVHNFLPEKPNNANKPTARFISLSNGVGSNYSDTYKKYVGLGNGGGDNNITT